MLQLFFFTSVMALIIEGNKFVLNYKYAKRLFNKAI